MQNSSLSDELNKLKSEINKIQELDDQSKEKLETLVATVELKINDTIDKDQSEQLIENIRESITEFEVSHPTLTGILNQIMVTLSNLGI